jgi:FkbM family methyltransferase
MLTKKEFKILLRSGSWRFMKDYGPSAFKKPVAVYRWKNRPTYYRPGSSDPDCIYKILLKSNRKSDCWVPQEVDPEVILDIGANIGIASVYYAERFPRASIYAFEPVPENFSLLERNVQGLGRVKAFPVALGEKRGEEEISLSATDGEGNYGGFSFHYEATKQGTTVRVENPAAYLSEIGLTKVDLIKIDTEGHEYQILRSFDQEMLSTVRWIKGDLHGVDDFLLLDYLSRWFDVELKKSLKKSIWMFNACNKTFLENLPTPHKMVALGKHRG